MSSPTSPASTTSTTSTTPPSTSTAPSSLHSPSSAKHTLTPLPPTPTPPPSPPTDPLTTLPPELLLLIISHLPSSTHLLPLSQTSTYLQSFILLTHAPTICTALIRTHHLPAASILHATLSPTGWLLPTHPSITNTESKLLREKILQTGCRCATCREILHSTSTSSSSSSLADLPPAKSRFNCLPSPSPSLANTTSCKATHHLASPWNLTAPGPLFLVFLEKYEWEIQTRYAMLQAALLDAEKNDLVSKEEEERKFAFAVGQFSVRRFLGDVERDFGGGGGEVREREEERRGIWAWVKGLRGLRGGRKKNKGEETRTESQNSKRPMFGEISPPPTNAIVEKRDARWMDGLVWYYGVQQGSSSPSSPSPLAGFGEGGWKSGEKSAGGGEEKRKNRSCIAALKAGAKHTGRKMKRVFLRNPICGFSREGSRFLALEG